MEGYRSYQRPPAGRQPVVSAGMEINGSGGLRRFLVLASAGLAAMTVTSRTARASTGDLVSLEIEAPSELRSDAERLRDWNPERLTGFASLLGLSGDDIDSTIRVRVVLAPESSAVDLGAPSWVAGYARADSSTVVLLPARVPVYPYRSLEELLGHEVAHLLIFRASDGRPLPRWFQEGLSMLAEEAWGLEDRGRVALTMLRQGRGDLAGLDRRFGDPKQVARAYTLAGAFVRDQIHRHGRDFPAALLRQVAKGEAFEQAFEVATGHSLTEAEDSFWHRFTFWYRWLPFLTSSSALWLALVLLALVAIRRRWQRDRALRQIWLLEEEGGAERAAPLRERAPRDHESPGS